MKKIVNVFYAGDSKDLVKELREIKKSGPKLLGSGICAQVPGFYKRIIRDVCQKWDKFSGDATFPVPYGTCSEYTAEEAYTQVFNKWDVESTVENNKEYARLRWELLDFLISYLEDCEEDVAEADFLLYMEEERRQADEEAYVSMFMQESEDGDVFVAGYDFGDYAGDGEVFDKGQTMLITNQDGKDIPDYACATFKYKGFDIAFDRMNAFIWCGTVMLHNFDTVEEAIAKIDGGMK